jgi:16S rRNA (guanine966-N2)-methyltransferase
MRGARGSASGGGAVRIIAGRWRGRRIAVPQGAAIRPTPNRIKETLFNWLQQHIVGARCLDLFAGTGALGIEALSRGAAHVEFVEQDRAAAAALGAQLGVLGAADHEFHVTPIGAARYLGAGTPGRFDIVFLDPPFALDLAELLPQVWPHVAADGLIYCEQALERGLPVLPAGAWIKTAKAGAVCCGLARP